MCKAILAVTVGMLSNMSCFKRNILCVGSVDRSHNRYVIVFVEVENALVNLTQQITNRTARSYSLRLFKAAYWSIFLLEQYLNRTATKEP